MDGWVGNMCVWVDDLMTLMGFCHAGGGGYRVDV